MGTVVSYRIREASTRTTDGETATAADARALRDAGGDALATAAAALERAQAKLRWVDDVFSTWKPQSPVSRLRRDEITLDEAPPEVAEVLELCRQARTASDGWFDPWRLPGGVDPTGLVKGWAAERALDEFKRAGVPAVMINAGGDIAVYGDPEPGEPWRIAVRDPSAIDRLFCVVEITGAGAVATSGAYERGDHVLDPNTGRPARGALSATVIGPDLAFADALATALFASGGRALERIGCQRGFHALVVDDAGALHATPDFPLAISLAA